MLNTRLLLRHRAALPLSLFCLALALRLPGIAAPLLDYHSWRQADTAAIARNFVASGYDLLHPQVDWGGETAGYVESEFPLYSFTLALLGAQPVAGRLISALASSAAVVFLWLLARPGGARVAVTAALTLALMPFAIYFGRTVMPDSLMLMLAAGALWAVRRWLLGPNRGRFLLAVALCALAPLAKTPNLVLLAPPLAYLVLAARPAPRRWPLVAVLALGFALPALLWTRYAATLPSDPRLSFGIGEKLFDLRLLTDPAFYILLATWAATNVLAVVGVPFALVGLLRPAQSPFRWLPHMWLAGVLLFLLAGAAGVVGQDYYILPLAGPLAWLVGHGVMRVHNALAAWKPQWPVAARWMPVIGLFVLLAGISAAKLVPLYRTADFYQTLGQRIDLALPPGERVGVIAPAVSEILYYGKRKGWRLDPGVIVPGGLSSLRPDLGVRYVVIADPWLTERRDVLTAALGEFRRVPVGPYALLLDLATPGSSAPAEMVWESGHAVEEPFLSFWRANGGAETFGLPISDALNGPEGRTQYFERAVLAEQNGQARRVHAGRLLLEAQGLLPTTATIDAALLPAWQPSGPIAPGEPLAPAQRIDGVLVQIGSFGTVEQPPGGAPQIGAIGRRLLAARGLTEEQQIVLACADAAP